MGTEGTERAPLWIVGAGDVDAATLETAAAGVTGQIDVDARVHSRIVDPGPYDGEAEPYEGLEFGRFVKRRTGRSDVLVVTDADIEKPRGEPAFGLAYKGGSMGIVSTARLGDPDDDRFGDRLRTEAAQHVGYLIGMGACETEGCLFRVADSPAAIDRIGPDPCAECRAELDRQDSPLLAGGDGARDPIERDRAFDEPSAWPDPLWIVEVGAVEGTDPGTVAASVREQFPLDVRVHPDPIDTAGLEGDDGAIEQPFDGQDLARYAALRADRSHVLALTDVDVAGPDGDWAFGVGELGGSLAAVSSARLGDPGDEPVGERLRTEALRQVGHLLGKAYCRTDDCLFASGADTRLGLDRVAGEPCGQCREELEAARERREDRAAGSGQNAAPDRSEADAANPVTHEVTSAARFWGAVGGYVASLFVTALVAVTLLDALPGVSVPDSGAGAWVFVVAMLLAGWYVYRKARRWIGGGIRRLVGSLRSAVAGDS